MPVNESNRVMRRLLVLVIAGAALLAGCQYTVATTPGAPQIRQATPNAPYVMDAIHANGRLVCIRRHETPGRSVWPYEDGYTYGFGRSGYREAYQMTQGLWDARLAIAEQNGVVPPGTWAQWNGAATAGRTPWWVQDLVVYFSIQQGLARHWKGTGCF